MAHGNILIVDDEPSILRALEGILGDEGFQVIDARDGEEALTLIQEKHFELVLLDIWMPGMDGIQTLQRLKALQPSLYVIVMSGHGNIETAVKATKLGAFDYLEKPLSLDSVLSSVHAAFDHVWKRREQHGVEVVQAAVEPLIGVENLPPHLASPLGSPGRPAARREYASLKEARRAWERQYLVEQLHKYHGNAAHVAHALQMNERGLQRRLSVLGIGQEEGMARPELPQRTLKRSVVIYGQGLQSGVKTGMILAPMPPNSGVMFGDIATG